MKNKLTAILIFPIAPFFSFLYACANLKNKFNGFVFILFYGLFGFTHTFSDIRADSYRKAWLFSEFNDNSYSDIWSSYIDGYIMDIYEGLLFVFLKQWTNDPHIMMAVVGAIGGFFIYLVLRRIIKDWSGIKNACLYILLVFILCKYSPVGMGGIRYFTAFAVFSYATISFLIDNNKKSIIGIVLSPLIHFSFILYIFVILFIKYIGFPKKLLFWLVVSACVASTFLSTSSWNNVISQVDIGTVNQSVASRTEHYATDETEAEFQSSLTVQIMKVQNTIVSAYVLIFLFYIKKRWNRLNINSYCNNLYKFLLFFLFFGYVFSSFSVVGQRYLNFAHVLLYFFILNIYVYNRNKEVKLFIYLMPFLFFANLLWVIYNCYCNTSLMLYISPLPLLFL